MIRANNNHLQSKGLGLSFPDLLLGIRKGLKEQQNGANFLQKSFSYPVSATMATNLSLNRGAVISSMFHFY